MTTTIPIDRKGIVRAAEEMIDSYGSQALTKAMERAQEMRAEGFESVANTWYLICQAIEDHQDFAETHQVNGTLASRQVDVPKGCIP